MHLRSVILFLLCTHYFITTAQTIILGQGNNQGITVTTSDNAQNTNGSNTTDSQGFLPNLNAASRFLSQASFGPNIEQIEALSSQGIENWIESQFEEARPFTLVSKVEEYKEIKNTAEGDPEGGAYDYYWNFAWWQYAMTSPDVLRQRLALALSEFFVVSNKSSFGDNAYALASYYDMLSDHVFGNYRSMLEAVTFHAAMGEYLTFMNNPKSDTLYNIDWDVDPPDTLSIQYLFPDENYARELMQLFSIGLCELNTDGSCKKDTSGKDIPSYDNVDIAEFAKIFTGFSYGDNMDFGYGPEDYELTFTMPMQIYNEYHEAGVKHLLNGTTVPARNPVNGTADVSDALDNLFNHPNVGPFLGKFLIQRLITSNPSPSYVERVAQAFNGESAYGSTRGDMKAVIKAILLDEEARSCTAADNDNHGKLREPFIRYVQLGKAFDLSTNSGNHRNALYNVNHFINQIPLGSPSVFNFFQSDYQPIGRIEEEGLVAPEFQIANTQTIAGYFNGLNQWLFDEEYVDTWSIYDGEPDFPQDIGVFDFTDELQLINENRADQLVERLNLILAHGKLTQPMTDAIVNVINEFEVAENITRVRLAIYLILASPEYLINR